MERLLNKRDLELQLEGKRADIDARIDALKNEIEGAGTDARRYLIEQPLKVVGGVLIAGVAVGLLMAGRKKRKSKRQLRKSHRALVERYAEALVQDVRFRLRRGDDEEKALRAAFRDRVPLIVVEGETDAEVRHGMVREGLDLALKTALGFAVKVLVDRLTAQFDLEGQIDRLVSSVMPMHDGSDDPSVAPAPDERVG